MFLKVITYLADTNYANYRCDERKYNMEIERAIKRRLHMIETIRESGGSGYLTKMTLLII